MAKNQGKNWEVGYKKPPRQTRFKKGQSGNSKGRPPGRTLLAVIREKLRQPDGDEKELEKVAQGFIKAMQRGSFPHLKEFIDREEGKVPDKTNVAGELTIKVIRDDKGDASSRNQTE